MAKNNEERLSSNLLDQIQAFMALDSIGVTTLRGQSRGTMKHVREFLKRIDLSQIPRRKASFEPWLDEQTLRLRRKLPDARPNNLELWGVARKSMNLFLRACLYNHYLRIKYHLGEIEMFLEVPLDSKVGKGLVEESRKAGNALLPRWTTLKRLKASDSKEFQEFATELAQEKGLPVRVFLDHEFFLM